MKCRAVLNESGFWVPEMAEGSQGLTVKETNLSRSVVQRFRGEKNIISTENEGKEEVGG